MIDAEIQSQLRRRVAALMLDSYAELLKLPQAQTERVSVLGKAVRFTTFRESHSDGRLLVLVRSDRAMFFGLGTAGTTEGFWVDSSGSRQEALHEEIADFYA